MIRKIQSREELEKKRERNNKIMVIVLGLILLLSTAGYFVSDYTGSKNPTVTYKNIKFEQSEYGYWVFQINNHDYGTRFMPEETVNVSIIAEKALGEYSGKVLYFASPGSKDYSEQAKTEIMNNLYGIVSKENFACLDESCLEDYPIKNCSENNLILFQRSETNRVSSQDKCIIIEYQDGQADLVADAFIFRILGLQ